MEPDVKEEVPEDVKEEVPEDVKEEVPEDVKEDVKEEVLEDPEISQPSSVPASHLSLFTPVTACKFLYAGASSYSNSSYSINDNGIAAKDAEEKLEEEEEDASGTGLMQLIIS